MVEIQKKLMETVKNSAADPEGSVQKLLALKQEIAKIAGEESPEYYNGVSIVHEAIGDVWLKAKKPAEAEKAYLEMVKNAGKVYELDKEKYDYRLGFSFYKRAAFYRQTLGCAVLRQKPVALNEQQKKLFDVTEVLYKNAVACTMQNAKKGALRYVELHALVLSELVVMYGAVGEYQKAIAAGKDGIRLEKAIYEKLDDKKHAFRLANRMKELTSVYLTAKDIQSAMETLEDAIFVLEEHEEEDPITFEIMLAMNYMTLAGCYTQIPEEASKASETYRTGLERVVEANKLTEGKFTDEVIKSYMVVGDFYKKTNHLEGAKAHYRWAMKMASDMYGKTKEEKYGAIVKQLETLV